MTRGRRWPPNRWILGETTRTSGALEFRLLGPLELTEHGRSLELGGVKQRSLLAILLLHANQVVSTDRLIDELWGAAPPATVTKSLQVLVSKLRKQLGESRLATIAPGYRLQVNPAELDLARFERLMGEARGADPENAARKLRQALALWRGPALADLAYESFAQAEIARLEELRLAALNQRIEADLAAGRHAELVGELESLVVQHPLRERLRCQLMLVLYRSGRQAEALDAFRAGRRELTEELGLEPSEELKQLEKAILRQDPALDVPGQPPAAALASQAPAPDRALLVVPRVLSGLESMLGLARPLAASSPPRELIVAGVVPPAELNAATAALADRRDELLADGLAARTAAFSSPTPGDDIVRLASQENVDLLLMAGGRSPLGGDAEVVLDQAPCDVALLVEASGSLRSGSVVVPFGAANHDWAALELGAWLARATGCPLRLIGAASDQRDDRRDASRLLADASLIVQRTAGIVAEPLLATPGRHGIVALAEGAGLLIIGLSDRWRQEGLGQVRSEIAGAPPAPTVFVRRGPRPGGLAPADTRTRFSWSMTGTAR
jgi:DNA-binding SARP family transcriptional activator